MSELEELGSSYPFSIPPFFTLILRAFSVIEGIALGVDPDYAIVQECFPYLARRLLAAEDPRVRKALRDVLYGGRQRLDVDRCEPNPVHCPPDPPERYPTATNSAQHKF